MTDTDVQTPENDKYSSIVDLAIDSNPAGIQTAFDAQIKDVITGKLETLKDELSKSMFDVGYEEQPEEQDDQPSDDNEDDDITDEEINQLSDEEWDELITQLETEDDNEEQTDGDQEDA